MLAAETASGGRVASVGACVPAAAAPGFEVVLYNTSDKHSGPLAVDWASGVDAAGTGFPSFAVVKAEGACWQRGRRHFPAAERFPPEGNCSKGLGAEEQSMLR